MEETPQREVTGLEQRARRRTRAELNMRIRVRAWVLYRDRAKDMDREALPQLGKECLDQATAFEETMDEVLGVDAAEVAPREYLEENGEPFAPAPQPSERDRGIVGKDARRFDALADDRAGARILETTEQRRTSHVVRTV